jgi:hypothetical protein
VRGEGKTPTQLGFLEKANLSLETKGDILKESRENLLPGSFVSWERLELSHLKFNALTLKLSKPAG